jgi:hypothetical protein
VNAFVNSGIIEAARVPKLIMVESFHHRSVDTEEPLLIFPIRK